MKKGDIIYASVVRKVEFGPRHYGVYDGSRGVYHYSGENINYVYVQFSSIEEFTQRGHVEVDNQYKRRFTPTEIIERAAKKIGSELGGYNLIDNNCEHFATWCVTGKSQSVQTDLAPESSNNSPIKIIKDLFSKTHEPDDDSST